MRVWTKETFLKENVPFHRQLAEIGLIYNHILRHSLKNSTQLGTFRERVRTFAVQITPELELMELVYRLRPHEVKTLVAVAKSMVCWEMTRARRLCTFTWWNMPDFTTSDHVKTAYLARPGFPTLIKVQQKNEFSSQNPFVSGIGLSFDFSLNRLLAPIGQSEIVKRSIELKTTIKLNDVELSLADLL